MIKNIVTYGKGICILQALILTVLLGCGAPARNIIYQTSTIDALLLGIYDGDLSCRDLLKHGDFGIGTFDGLDGEMIILEGAVYQVKGDGQVHKPDPNTKTPFATTCYFNPGKTISIDARTDDKQIESLIDAAAPSQNLFCAIKITGHFRVMRTRSVPAQRKPYPPLKEVARNQTEFEMKDVYGTIVGFRCPPYVKGINVPGYHLHFINEDKNQGGHVLSFEMIKGKCGIDILNHYFLRLPYTKDFAEADLSGDQDKDLNDVEKGSNRTGPGNSK